MSNSLELQDPKTRGGGWIKEWTPEDADFWESTGKAIAWRTVWVTTFCLILGFTTWFMVSAIVVRLQGAGFNLNTTQLFWLTAMPGLAGGTLRIVHTFLVPIFGTRKTVAVSTFLLLLPCIGWAYAVQNPQTPYAVLLMLSFLTGLGGGNFSSFMPSTSLFFPRRLQGTVLAIQAGIGNFGVSVAQFLVPWVISFAAFGGIVGQSQTFTKDGKTSAIWLQNGVLVWVPFILIGTALAWFLLRSVPVRATFREQLDIFKDRHTWFMTSLYIMTFGSFSGFSATFPLMIKSAYGGFENAPDPLKFAFLGPLVGAASRVLFGPITDKVGGAIVTHYSGLGLMGCAIGVSFFADPTSMEQFPLFVTFMLGIFFFAGIGNASTFKQMPMIFQPRQAGGVIGWTGAVGAYGPFFFAALIGYTIGVTGSPVQFFYGAAIFYALNIILNWWYYSRKNAEKPC